jgi:hypothetical protein
VPSACVDVSVAPSTDGLLFLAFAHGAMVAFPLISTMQYQYRYRANIRLLRRWGYAF